MDNKLYWCVIIEDPHYPLKRYRDTSLPLRPDDTWPTHPQRPSWVYPTDRYFVSFQPTRNVRRPHVLLAPLPRAELDHEQRMVVFRGRGDEAWRVFLAYADMLNIG